VAIEAAILKVKHAQEHDLGRSIRWAIIRQGHGDNPLFHWVKKH
jgi:hypothetical protein